MQGTIIFLSVDIILAVCLALRIASYVMYSIILNNMFIVSFNYILCPSAIVTIVQPYKKSYALYNKLDAVVAILV